MNFNKKLEDIRERFSVAQEERARREVIRRVLSEADSWVQRGGMDQALEALQLAADEAADIQAMELAAKAHEQRAMLLNQADRSAEALEAIERAIDIVAGLALDDVRREMEVRKSIVLASLGRVPEAIQLVDSLLEQVDEDNADYDYSRLLGLLGHYHLRAAQNREAEKVYRQAIERAAAPSVEHIRLQVGLSQALAGQEKYSQAQRVLLEQWSDVREGEMPVDPWDLLEPAIEISHQVGDWETLVSLTKEAIELASKEGDYKEANLHRENLISVLLQLDRLEEAKAHLEIALDYARRKGPKERKLVHLMSLGRVAFNLGEMPEGLEYYQKALKSAESQGNERAVITILGRMGAIRGEQGALEAALEFGERAVSQAEEAGDLLILAEQNVLLALTYRDMGRLDAAMKASQRAERLYQQQGETEFAERARQLQAEIKDESGQPAHELADSDDEFP